jgi:hypothetical protein
MIKLNDYLYSGDTVLKIIQTYGNDLKKSALRTGNEMDLAHSEFIRGIQEVLEHNEFLSSQSGRILDFYKYMAKKYPFLAFTFKGRIKSLIRSEEKFNSYVVEYITDYYKKHHSYPDVEEIIAYTRRFRDLVAYRIVISLPKCHLAQGENREEAQIGYLYEIANVLPSFLEERGFVPQAYVLGAGTDSEKLDPAVRPYYKDYVANAKMAGYRSLHVAFHDDIANCNIELQLRTKEMDDYAEIGKANHSAYEMQQSEERSERSLIPEGECLYFDEAYERICALQDLDLAKVDVNMFGAANNYLINDGCGLFRGRQILPYEHLSRFQNDLIG